MSSTTDCRICGNASGNRTHSAREMMFGFRDRFTYLECAQCGCVQLLDPPADMARYYPRDYYSYAQHGWFKTALRHQWSANAFGAFAPVGWLVSRCFFDNSAMRSLRPLRLPRSARILEVGCGSGHLLLDLAYLGFQSLAGADPYIQRELVYPEGPIVHKKEVTQMSGVFDLIMLHHSFEHMDRPAEIMLALGRLLAPQGRVVLRIPVASSYAWKQYGIHWFNLDAPRHLYLHTHKTIHLLAERAGLRIVEVAPEGDSFSFLASEAYAQDIPMNDPRFPRLVSLKNLVPSAHRRELKIKAAETNRTGQADLVCFYLEKTA